MEKKKTYVNNAKREKDRFTVVLELIQSDFQAFGEKLDYTNNRLDTLEGGVAEINLRLDRIEAELLSINFELSSLKKVISDDQQPRLMDLERRVKHLEKILAEKKHS